MSDSSYFEKVMDYKPHPDFSRLEKVLKKENPGESVLFEFFLNERIYSRLSGEKLSGLACDSVEYSAVMIKAFEKAGYDYATVRLPCFCFPAGERHTEESISLNEGALITDRPSFNAYAWPEPEKNAADKLEKMAADKLPDKMRMIVCGPGGVLENVIRLVGYDNLCMMLYDDPELVQDIFDAIGSRLVRYYGLAAPLKHTGACISNDDWGFKTQSMLPPDAMRKYVFPWHKKIVETIHDAGKYAILHSCGNASEIWEDIIEVIKYDGKHSYEDAISPVEKEYEKFAGRIGVMGGLDVHFVATSEPDVIYRRALEMLKRASEKGSYALGTGNSVPEFVPDENFAAMIWAALETR
ncbi:MAG: hypothetical protein A2020_01115 [Lentisphaerae bacterium GWF2_45_14]|nr:MAG: hypothetical protein A2020_01115 [Lentisphaerae bacterium GWF2_45_14]